jgi:AraC-like DNA-binding protein
LELFALLNQTITSSILDILSKNSSTKEQIILWLHISEEKVTEALRQLIEAELIYQDGMYYIISSETFEKAAIQLMKYCTANEFDIDDNEPYRLDTRQALNKHFFAQRETGFHHASFDRELAFYESVRSGSLETVKTLFTPLGGEGFGVLSYDPLRNLKYHLVVSIAMVTRFCINGGMLPEEAYNLSDIYILKTDASNSKEEINTVHYEMTVDFTRRMRQIQNGRVYSKPIILALDYISDRLHNKILIQDIADYLSLSVPYFSRLFKMEIGLTFSDYVTVKKIEAAANMLQFSDYSAVEISNYFNFSSHSYFIKVFKRHMGLTPKEYRSRYYSIGWMHGIFKNEC